MTEELTIDQEVDKICQLKPRELATHVGKISHPDAQVNLFAKSKKRMDGLLHSGNVKNTEVDSPGNASTLAIAKFLLQKMTDDKTLWEHLQKETDLAKSFLRDSYQRRDELLQLLVKLKPTTSGSELKQVYFPVAGDYHLLSIIVSSGVILKLKEKIDELRFPKLEATKTSRKAKQKNEYCSDNYEEIYGLTTISYGGANAQNISYLAPKLKGSKLLSSLPPVLDKKMALPSRNFFRYPLRAERYRETFHSFHKLQVASWNNEKIRDSRDRYIEFLLDEAVRQSWIIRQGPAGWGDSKNLLSHQRHWLDNQFQIERENGEFDSDLAKVSEEFARWFIRCYEKIIGKDAQKLSDDFFKHIVSMIDIENLR